MAETVGSASVNVELKLDKAMAQFRNFQQQIRQVEINAGIRGGGGGYGYSGGGGGGFANTALGAGLGSKIGRIAGEEEVSSNVAKKIAGFKKIEIARMKSRRVGPDEVTEWSLFEKQLDGITDSAKKSAVSVKSLKSLFATAGVARYATVAGIGYAGARGTVTALRNYSNLNEEISKTEVLFRNASGEAEAFVKTFTGPKFGLAEMEVRGLVNNLQSALAPLLGDRKKAAELATRLGSRALDIGSLKNMSADDVSAAMVSSLMGERQSAMRLGAAHSAKDLERISGKTTANMSEVEKILARAEIIMQRTADANGDLERTSGSLAHSWRAAAGSAQNFSANIGGIVNDTLHVSENLRNAAKAMAFISDLIKQSNEQRKEPVKGSFFLGPMGMSMPGNTKRNMDRVFQYMWDRYYGVDKKIKELNKTPKLGPDPLEGLTEGLEEADKLVGSISDGITSISRMSQESIFSNSGVEINNNSQKALLERQIREMNTQTILLREIANKNVSIGG